MENFIGKKCVVRGDRSGVFFGTAVSIDGSMVEMSNVRKLWYWDGANAVEQLAVDGTKKPEKCKFTVHVSSLIISDMIQILPCTGKSISSLESVKEWRI